ncbi:endonuclease V isoform X3 [Hyperolius riggenbachi]|uniref:endonuclease V isoform X3 n=1 Tax=Hyperolius riggenbachi TaxID=752182 RepID=UPI0035A2BB75
MEAAVKEEEGRNSETLQRWEREQSMLKEQLIIRDTDHWQSQPDLSGLQQVGGVDLSYIKGDDTMACASLVVLSYPDLEVIYEDCRMVTLDAPYVAGFLAFREVPSLVEAVERLKEERPDLMPQVLLVDGNGILHHRVKTELDVISCDGPTSFLSQMAAGFGIACHLGILAGLPTIGVAKNLLQVDGLENNEAHKEQADIRSREFCLKVVNSSTKEPADPPDASE